MALSNQALSTIYGASTVLGGGGRMAGGMGYSLDLSASSSARSGDVRGDNKFGQNLTFDHSGFVVNFGNGNTNDTRGTSSTPTNSYSEPAGVMGALGINAPQVSPLMLVALAAVVIVCVKRRH